jgi:hypothetical protein
MPNLIIINRTIVATKGIHGGRRKTMCRLAGGMVLFKKVVKIQLRRTRKCSRKRKTNTTMTVIKWLMATITTMDKAIKRKGM